MRFTFALMLSLLLATGCARVSDKVAKDIDPGDTYVAEIPTQKSPLKMDVKVESSTEVTGCLYALGKEDSVMKALLTKKDPADALAFEKGKSSFTLAGTVPASEEGRIWIKNTGTSKATLKINIVGY